VEHLVILTRRVPPAPDGVGDYTYHLARAIAGECRVTILTTQGQQGGREHERFEIVPLVRDWGFGGWAELWALLQRLQPTVVNIQWVPFMWGRYGINFSLPLLALRLRWAGYVTTTTVHELYVRIDQWGRLIVGPIQRLQLLLLILGSTRVIATTECWRHWILRYMPWRRHDVICVPAGSNIPLPEGLVPDRAECRRRLQISHDQIVVAVFSPFSAGKMLGVIARTWGALRGRYPGLQLVVIGADADEMRRRAPSIAWDESVRWTGYLPPADVSTWLWASDLLLAPFDDGISTRRTSVITALAHGLPVVSTRGALTDRDVFDNSPVVLTDVDDEAGIVDAVERLIRDRDARHSLRQSSLGFYQSHFAWPSIAEQVAVACLRT
jgi:glycosyltransferase involved in cell wall biosynthesis